jgi:hypothetical protein
MSKMIFTVLAAIAIIGAVSAATVTPADARCGFVNGYWNGCR